jgi:hypothetical protein
MHDAVVVARAMPKLQAWVEAHGYFGEKQPSFTVQVLNEMTAAEKKALEGRIVARHLRT